MLRAWLNARNPLLVPYLGWAAGFGFLTTANLVVWLSGNRPDGPADIAFLAGVASLPLLPILGFHLNQARRQFLAGHTLTDLRSALEIARREREETESLTRDKTQSPGLRVLRLATMASAAWLATTFGLVVAGVLHENRGGLAYMLAPVLSTMLFGAISNALDVPFVPTRIRNGLQTGIRDRLWKSRLGKWVAQRLGAPEQSRAVGGGVFRPTEAVLGVAASDLFAALPQAYRDQLADLPDILAALEARAAEARADIDVVAALAAAGSDDDNVLATRRTAAAARLADSVAALERMRLDLLRLHAGAGDLAPLTTLIEQARVVGDEVARLADAQNEVNAIMQRPAGSRRMPTPA
jgi:serine/threonine-protein kinase